MTDMEHRARALTSLMGMDDAAEGAGETHVDSDPWLIKMVLEAVRLDLPMGEARLEDLIGPDRSQAIADILPGLDGSDARRHRDVLAFDGLLLGRKSGWMDPSSSPSAHFLLEMPVGVSLVLERPTKEVTLLLDVSEFRDQGMRLLESLAAPVASVA